MNHANCARKKQASRPVRRVIATAFAALCLLSFGSTPLAAKEDMARIVTQNSDPTNCISRVAIRTINGRDKFVSPQGFSLEPGTYTLSGTVALDTSICRVAPGNTFRSVPPLEATFEAGKTYFIGFDHSSPNRDDWAYVIWKVE